MTHIYDALLRIEKLYDCKTATDTANLLGMPKMTFFDNRRKALEDYKKIEQLKNEQNPVKKAILEKTINANGKTGTMRIFYYYPSNQFYVQGFDATGAVKTATLPMT